MFSVRAGLNGCTVKSALISTATKISFSWSRPAQGLIPALLADVLRLVTGILDAEPDQVL